MFFGSPTFELPEVAPEPRKAAPAASIPDGPATDAARAPLRREAERMRARAHAPERSPGNGRPANAALDAAMGILLLGD